MQLKQQMKDTITAIGVAHATKGTQLYADEAESLRVATLVVIDGAAIPEQRYLPGPESGRLSSKDGQKIAAADYEGDWGWM